MNQLYQAPRKQFLTNQFDWANMPAVLVAWRGAYVFDETHALVADIVAAGGDLVVQSLPLTGQGVITGGYAMSDPAVLPAVPAGAPVTFFTLVDMTVSSLPAPILYIDQALGLPFSPSGLDEIVQPDWLQHRGWFRP